MVDIKDLERKWLKYKIKLYFKRAGILVVILTIIYILFPNIFNFNNSKEFKEQNSKEHSKEIRKDNRTSSKIAQESKLNSKISISKVDEQNQSEIILRKREANIANILKNKFNSNPTKSIALELAKEEFKRENFKEAINWAIKTNEFDDIDSEAWIIFAKSKVKLNRVNEAIEALKLYLGRYKSTEIQNFLDKLIERREVSKVKPQIERESKNRLTREDILKKLKYLKRSYYQNPNISLARDLSENYIKIANYKNSLFWADKVLKINQDDEDGHIYKAICKLELGSKEEAIKLLKEYLKQVESKKIEILLKKIIEGRKWQK